MTETRKRKLPRFKFRSPSLRLSTGTVAPFKLPLAAWVAIPGPQSIQMVQKWQWWTWSQRFSTLAMSSPAEGWHRENPTLEILMISTPRVQFFLKVLTGDNIPVSLSRSFDWFENKHPTVVQNCWSGRIYCATFKAKIAYVLLLSSILVLHDWHSERKRTHFQVDSSNKAKNANANLNDFFWTLSSFLLRHAPSFQKKKRLGKSIVSFAEIMKTGKTRHGPE